MDKIDTQILRLLIADSHITNSKLAKQIGLSESATLERVKRLEAAKVIRRYTIEVDLAKIGRTLEVFITFTLKNQHVKEIDSFMQAMKDLDEVLSCAQVLGRFDFVAHIAVKDVEALQQFINNKLIPLGCIARMESLTVLKMVKRIHQPNPVESE